MSIHVQPLFDGPVDIVGDIHGEIEALDALLVRLGYSPDGKHAHGRRLVFVGDLVDRGANSPAVVERVAEMVVAGRAQAVLGNHELNLVLGEAKEGNGWLQSEEFDHDAANEKFTSSVRATPTQRTDFLNWFSTLPLALERVDLRVVHACWSDTHIATMREDARSTNDIYLDHDSRITSKLKNGGQFEARDQELARWARELVDIRARIPMLPGVATIDSMRQTAHPIKALTSGIEQPAEAPFFASGKWRMTERVAWWDQYDDAAAVVMGHYWRWPGSEEEANARARGPNVFSAKPFEWIGIRRNVMCVDWCVGLRWRERQAGHVRYQGKLGALRWNEREIVLDS